LITEIVTAVEWTDQLYASTDDLDAGHTHPHPGEAGVLLVGCNHDVAKVAFRWLQ
jgi:hypothetical protein